MLGMSVDQLLFQAVWSASVKLTNPYNDSQECR